MLQYKVLLLVVWTRVVCGLSAEYTSTTEYDLPQKTSPVKNSIEDFEGEFKEGRLQQAADATVRNFFPEKGKQKWMRREFPPVTEMLFFNISAIGDNEEVTLAQLHLHRRRLAKSHGTYHKRFLPSPYRVVLYQVQPNYRRKSHEDARTMKLASLPVSHITKGGWHTLDVTAVVREILINAQGPVELLFGVHFEAPKRLEKSYSPLVPIKHFLKSPGMHSIDHSNKASSYLVVFSERDPYFEDSEESESFPATSNFIPTTFKKRHLKHKMLKEKGGRNESESNLVEEDSKKKTMATKEKSLWKYKKMENEVYKGGRIDVIRHRGKHRGNDVKRSKADELALKERTKLKSLPFLHANEVEEIRLTSRRLTRSSGTRGSQQGQETRPERRKLINAAEVQNVESEP